MKKVSQRSPTGEKKSVRKTTVIGLLGGPGCGKSTLAAALYANLKQQGLTVELVREYAKNWAWRGEAVRIWDEPYLFTKQLRAESTLYGKVDYIVTDRPLGMSIVYEEFYNPDCSLLRLMYDEILNMQCARDVVNLNLLVKRTKKYVTAGRFETEDKARLLDELCLQMFANPPQVETVGDVLGHMKP
jgi:nicotinamide riboside kinase